MKRERFCASDYRFVAICAILLAATVWFTARNFYRAFPEASIDFRVSRAEARSIAGRFLASRGGHTDSFRDASSFTFDDQAKTFLEREAGLERANGIMGSRVRLWRWSYRWFKPRQAEEYRVEVTPSGELAGFEHRLPEDAARPAVSLDEARRIAEDFLRSIAGRNPASLEFVESSEVARPHRVDRVFAWKERDFDLGGSSIRREVTVLGNEPGGYSEYLKIPERWTRDYERLRSRNEMAQTVDTALVALLAAGLVVVIVNRIRRQDVRWRRAALVGTIGMALSLLASLNELPAREFAYPTTDSFQSFIAAHVFQALLGALAGGGLLFLLAAGAEPIYREAFPAQISLGSLFGARGIGTRRFFLGTLLGLALTGFFLAYQTAFYIVASRWGAWSPADVPYSDLLNTRFPWLFVLLGGYFPAVSEEFLFRMFAIPFVRKPVRSLPAAIAIAGFVWGFGHAGYPQQPFFIRGLEVGIGGVILGAVVLRWGILPALVWHYSVDAMYSAMLMVRSQNLYFRLSGAAAAGIMVVPVVVALVLYWRRGGFEPETGLLNRDDTLAAPPLPAPPAPAARPAGALPYLPMPVRVRIAAVAVFALGLAAWLVPLPRFGDSPSYKLDKTQARAASDAFLRAQGAAPEAFRAISIPATHWGNQDRLAARYFVERLPTNVVASLFERNRPVRYWMVRYFKSLDAEGWEAAVHPATGAVMNFVHTIPEDRPGADLPPEDAERIAASFAASRGVDVKTLNLKESTSEKRKSRRDHTLIWEARDGDPRNVAETRYRVEAVVSGDRVTALGSYWKAPETYERSLQQTTWLSILLLILRVGGAACAAMFALALVGHNIRQGLVHWGTAVRMGIAGALVAALGQLLSSDRWLENYNSAVPLATFEAHFYVTLLLLMLFGFLAFGAVGALLSSSFPDAFAAFRRENRRSMGKDAAAALAAAAGFSMLLRLLESLLSARFHAQALLTVEPSSLVGGALPSVSALAAAIGSVLANAGILAVAVLLAGHVKKRGLFVPLLLVAPAAMVTARVHTPGEFALAYALALAPLVCAAWFCTRLARHNYLAYGLVLWMLALQPRLAELFGSGNPSLAAHGWIVAAAFALTVLWALAPAFAAQRKNAPATAA